MIKRAVLLWALNSFACLASEPLKPPKQSWTFEGARGSFDRAALQRGFQVYKEVCSTCHGLKRIRFRELQALGFSEEEIKVLSNSYEITDGLNEEGEPSVRKGRPSDALPNPFKNDNAARAANNGALPPDLSLIVKARAFGPDYINALLTGFKPVPPNLTLGNGMYYNEFFPGHQITMAPPFVDGQVIYGDKTQSTVRQMAHDVTTFLAWCAEPEMEARKQKGWQILIFFGVLTVLLGILMRLVWRDVEDALRKPPAES
jgi:ubiquinol-cytochrome c reductase cytochrome c1 subunit